ncbi:hypothetical protein [Burkholderia ubonensis]|uniref:hypothetical protein n=1 Tax=Burkholderia ubonensis TaxID=101571 RepID=UPI0007555091|nr:hypothetical protein [Burkholderia ubonensis]KVL70318.1 hypothetical protein WJ49_22655 [Burkholderia ubonensis]KVL73181.1 hypothetical protein WJ48_00350 [Burkholderia ubonensis]KVL91009.1 hypothetical protein WJ50_12790 [Burkholderia ubonensis]
MKRLFLTLLLASPMVCLAKTPACASWPTNMAIASLKNAGITDPTKLDESKTKAVLLASEKTGKDLYRQIYNITFYEKSGAKIQVITRSEASSSECSMSGVDVYVVSQKIEGGL